MHNPISERKLAVIVWQVAGEEGCVQRLAEGGNDVEGRNLGTKDEEDFVWIERIVQKGENRDLYRGNVEKGGQDTQQRIQRVPQPEDGSIVDRLYLSKD